jgi:hypothetical protein
MDTWASRVVLVAAGDDARRRSYRESLDEEFNVWTAADRLGVYERVGSVVDVVVADESMLGRDGLGPETVRDATDGCRIVLAGTDDPGIDADVVMPEPDPERLVATTERLLIESVCDRLLDESWTLAERKARLELRLDAQSRAATDEYRATRKRFDELDRRLDELVERGDLDWATLFDHCVATDGSEQRAITHAAE